MIPYLNLMAATRSIAESAAESAALSHAYPNKIIGGDFSTNPWQRGTSFAAIASGAYSADRWTNGNTTAAVVTIEKTADAPTAAQAGYFTQHCLHVAVTTADPSIAAGDVFWVSQKVEGYNAAAFGFGQSGTRYVTVSFWVKSTKTGIFCVALTNGAVDRSYVKEYTVNTTDAWEYKTLTFPVDTSGTWLYDNGIGLVIYFVLANGSTRQTAADAWAAGTFISTSNQVNAMDSTSNDFKLALIKLEPGSVATPFEWRSVGTELALCQRYLPAVSGTGPLGTGHAYSAANALIDYYFGVRPRVPPTGLTAAAAGEFWLWDGAGNFVTCNASPALYGASALSATLQCSVAAGLTAGRGTGLYGNSSSASLLFTGCEL